MGGGIVGLATAYRALEQRPGISVTVLEKEPEVGRHQSSHNSGVLHAGLYYKPGSLKARLAVSGIRKMVAFCRENGVAHEVCGKLVVATDEAEVARLRDLLARGMANGLRDLRWLGGEEIREREPHCAGIAAVHVPEEGIVDYPAVCAALRRNVEARGGEVRTGWAVHGIRREPGGWRLLAGAGEMVTDTLVNCAGLHSDRIAELAGEPRLVRIVPFRGEYYKLRPDREGLVKHLIYPVPDPGFPFLGVHFTRMIHGGVEAGPNAVLAFAREGYRKRDVSISDLSDALTFGGLWRFFGRHRKMCWAELRRSFSRDLFCRSLQRLVPEIEESDLSSGGAGVRAQAMSPDGQLVQDFVLLQRPNALHLINAPSPAATASLAIADEIVTRLWSN